LPERPLLSVPFLRSCIARLTFLDAFFPYLAIVRASCHPPALAVAWGLFISSICFSSLALSKLAGTFSSWLAISSSMLGRDDSTPLAGTSPLAIQTIALRIPLRKSSWAQFQCVCAPEHPKPRVPFLFWLTQTTASEMFLPIPSRTCGLPPCASSFPWRVE